jgi:hypothetical protein
MSFVVKHPLGQAAIDNPVAYPVGLEKRRRCRAAGPAARQAIRAGIAESMYHTRAIESLKGSKNE